MSPTPSYQQVVNKKCTCGSLFYNKSSVYQLGVLLYFPLKLTLANTVLGNTSKLLWTGAADAVLGAETHNCQSPPPITKLIGWLVMSTSLSKSSLPLWLAVRIKQGYCLLPSWTPVLLTATIQAEILQQQSSGSNWECCTCWVFASHAGDKGAGTLPGYKGAIPNVVSPAL